MPGSKNLETVGDYLRILTTIIITYVHTHTHRGKIKEIPHLNIVTIFLLLSPFKNRKKEKGLVTLFHLSSAIRN